MPLPVAHSLAGAAIYAALDEDGTLRPRARLLTAVAIANAPDLDLLPGILLGDPNRFHHGVTHTLGAALLAGAVAWLVARRWRGWPSRWAGLPGAVAAFVVVFLLWTSHVALDVVTDDPSAPAGVPALWPLLSRYFSVGPLFLRADKIDGAAAPGTFLLSLLSTHNLIAVIRETLLLGPLVLLVRVWRRFADDSGRS